MRTILITNARLVTMIPGGTSPGAGNSGPRRGSDLNDLGVIESGWLRIQDDRIVDLGEGEPPGALTDGLEGDAIDAGGSVVMPTFVDCHTHACWVGSRLDEFEQKMRGASYLDILKAGGGIMSTVRAVREASPEELSLALLRRVTGMVALGTGALEVKSGYGLNTETELKMLRVIHSVSQFLPQTIVGTFLGAHAMDRDQTDFVKRTIEETLPAVVDEFPGIVCDAYCEEGAWSVADTIRLFEAAREYGCPLRVHADQFNSLGMTREAIALGALSVDHLEASTPEDIAQLAASSTFGVALPCAGFHLDDRYAPAREFVDAGGLLAIATNCNPGSAPCPSMPFTIALACRKLHLTPAEAITASTWNAACVLGVQSEIGALAPGYRANIQLLDTLDERDLAFELGGPGPLMVLVQGHIMHTRAIEQSERTGDDDDADDVFDPDGEDDVEDDDAIQDQDDNADD